MRWPDTSASDEADREHGRPDARIRGISAGHDAHIAGDAQGLPVSLSGLLQYQLVQGQIRNSTLKPSVLPLEILQAARLINLEPTVLSAPAIVTLLRYPNASTNLPNRPSLGQKDLCLTQVIDCLLYTSPSPRDATLSRMPSSA